MTYRPYNTITATSIESTTTNNSGTTIDKAIPVKSKASGGIELVNVSIESDVLNILGVTSALSSDGSAVNVTRSGRVYNIATAYAIGDSVYISKLGYLTNVKPSKDVDGFVALDFVVRIGMIVRNETNPLNKDLVLDICLVGQLG